MALSEPLPMSPVNGAVVRALDGEDVGIVSDVVLDGSSGRIRYLIVQLRHDSKLVVVPWDLVAVAPGERAVRLNVSAKKLHAAPSFDRIDDARVASAEWQREICEYYGCRPYWEESWDGSAQMAEHHQRRGGAAQLVFGFVLLALVAGLGYVTYRQGWTATAGQVSGVAAVVREKTQVFRTTSADAATTAKVKTALALAKNVSAMDINVDTYNGVTTLTGKVPSPENRDLAGQIAADTSGVGEVRNRLTVDPEIRPEQGRQYLASRIEELERQTAIAEALQDVPEMEGARVKVRVTGDVVTLDGTVISDSQKLRADQVARSFSGVKRVDNQLRSPRTAL